MLTEAYLNMCDAAFFTLVMLYSKNILYSIELPLNSIFYTTHPFMKKLTTLKTSRKKVLLTMGLLFLEIQNCTMEWCHQ